MGGTGSGSYWRVMSKSTTSQYRSIDVRRLHREGLLEPFRAYSLEWSRDKAVVASIIIATTPKALILAYRHRVAGGNWEDRRYEVQLDWTPCFFGGYRPWFRCPNLSCRRRVATLYGGDYFCCRHCYKMAYDCQRENVGYRAMRKAEKIRERLGWRPGIAQPNGGKPKGMHWKTYERLVEEHNELAVRSLYAALGNF